VMDVSCTLRITGVSDLRSDMGECRGQYVMKINVEIQWEYCCSVNDQSYNIQATIIYTIPYETITIFRRE